MNFARRDPVGARNGGCEQGFRDYFFVLYKIWYFWNLSCMCFNPPSWCLLANITCSHNIWAKIVRTRFMHATTVSWTILVSPGRNSHDVRVAPHLLYPIWHKLCAIKLCVYFDITAQSSMNEEEYHMSACDFIRQYTSYHLSIHLYPLSVYCYIRLIFDQPAYTPFCHFKHGPPLQVCQC